MKVEGPQWLRRGGGSLPEGGGSLMHAATRHLLCFIECGVVQFCPSRLWMAASWGWLLRCSAVF